VQIKIPTQTEHSYKLKHARKRIGSRDAKIDFLNSITTSFDHNF
jgi:hypothetical protein